MIDRRRGLAAALAALALTACGGGGGGSPAPTPPPTAPPPTAPPPGAPGAGLDARPSNLTCVAPAVPSAPAGAIRLERVFGGRNFESPLAMQQAPEDDSRWYVVERGGRVLTFASIDHSAPEATFASVAVNDSGEGGLLGMAFHPTNPAVFLSWTEGSPMQSVVARFTLTADGRSVEPGAPQEILRVQQPTTNNHKGGHIAFGPNDGMLYIGLGDGGGANDPNGNAQNTTNLLGDFLRIDVDGAAPYAIPPDNPFATSPRCTAAMNAASCPEIYAWGVRNPWRWSFDAETGDLWAGDVGQGEREEVDRIRRGGNYGWDCQEGSLAGQAPAASCATTTGFVPPEHEYEHSLGQSITGGYVYRGSALPGLQGRYVFGDFVTGRIWQLQPGESQAEELLDTAHSIASFAQGNDGELYVIHLHDVSGAMYRIVDGGGGQASPTVATSLAATGCVDVQNPTQPAAGLVPYDVAAPFWSDGVAKERWLGIPNGTSIAVGADGDFDFPPGSVLMKHFRSNGALLETRLFMHHPNGAWAGYSYEWNAQQTDAVLVQGGKSVPLGGAQWRFPSGNECLTCHTAAAGRTLGLETAQLNRDFTYASTGRTANQLRTLDAITMFTTPLGDPAVHPALPDPFGSAPLDARARAYLHTNCAQCHRPGGPAPTSLDLRFGTTLANTAACAQLPQNGDLGMGPSAQIIAPGDAAASVLLARISRRDANGMPPLASSVVDTQGAALIQEWIESLTGCQ